MGFKYFILHLKLSDKQMSDAEQKYNGVSETLHNSYYETKYDGRTKFLFGSYKMKTNIRPIDECQDVDVIFKMPEEDFNRFKNYESNGPAALLQEIRNILNEHYTTTEKIRAWGKVVLVQFADGTHNVEVLPALELEDGTFEIPNSENGGSWEIFDPRDQLNRFNESNSQTNGLTRDLIKMIKSWVKNTKSLEYKSYDVTNDVIEYLETNYSNGADYEEYKFVVRDFFEYIGNKYENDEDKFSHIKTAYERVTRAISYEEKGKCEEATKEWRKVFGDLFPKVECPEKKEAYAPFTKYQKPYAKWEE